MGLPMQIALVALGFGLVGTIAAGVTDDDTWFLGLYLGMLAVGAVSTSSLALWGALT